MTATRILVEFASCIIDLDSTPKADLDDPRPDLPSFTASWPAVSEDRLRLIRHQALETTLMVASVQAAGVYLSDMNDEARERASVEKGGNTDKGTTPAKKKSLDRRQGRQDLRVSPSAFGRSFLVQVGCGKLIFSSRGRVSHPTGRGRFS